LDAYASCFAQAGLAALVFDYRHCGASEGEPRQLLDIKLQLADWAAAIAFARALDGIDAERIALWGTSFSGGHVIELAARDKRVAAVVAQVPFVDGFAIMRSDMLANIRLLAAWMKDELRRRQKKSPYYVKIVGAPGALAAITSPGSEAGMRAMVLEDAPWQDSVAGRIFFPVGFYRPVKVVPRVQCPLLICVCDRDMVTPPGPAIKAAHKALHGELRQYAGTHFDIYVGELFEKAVADQTAFLTRCVLNAHPSMESRASM
jgi:pimeloyl-ACP methyl ester carboxylesterase